MQHLVCFMEMNTVISLSAILYIKKKTHVYIKQITIKSKNVCVCKTTAVLPYREIITFGTQILVLLVNYRAVPTMVHFYQNNLHHLNSVEM